MGSESDWLVTACQLAPIRTVKMIETEIADHGIERSSLHEKNLSDLEKMNGTGHSSISDGDIGDYPTGFRMVFIIVALILAIFLTSLDFVSYEKSC